MPTINVGDTVRCVHASPYALTLNRLYLVLSVEPDGTFLTVTNDLGTNARYAAYRFTADLAVPDNSVPLSSTPLRDAMFAIADADSAEELTVEINFGSDDDEEEEEDYGPEDYLTHASRMYCENGEYLDNGYNDTGTLRERVAPGDILMYLYSGERVRVVRHTMHSGEFHVVPIEHDDDEYFTIYPYCDEHAIVRQRTTSTPPQTTVKAGGKNIKVLTLKDIK